MWTSDLQPPRLRMDRHLIYCRDQVAYETTLETLSNSQSVYIISNPNIEAPFIVTRGRDPSGIGNLNEENILFYPMPRKRWDLVLVPEICDKLPVDVVSKIADIVTRCLAEDF